MLNILVKKQFANELPALTPAEEKDLRKSIERDGVLDSLKYWTRPKTGETILLDGHNRKRIADELGKEYTYQEIFVNTDNEALYWMHRNQGARRGGGRNAARMSQLWQLIQAERGKSVSQNEADKQAAKDAKVTTRTVRDQRQKQQEAEDKPDKVEPISRFDRAVRVLQKLSTEDLERLMEWIQKTLDNA